MLLSQAVKLVEAFADHGDLLQSGFIVNANYFGPQEEGLSYLQPFIDLKPVIQSVKMVNWTGVFADAYFGLDTTGCVKGQYVNAYTEALKQTDVDTLESFFADLSDFSATNFPSIRASLVIHRFPTQAVLAVPDNDTVYPYRDIKMHV